MCQIKIDVHQVIFCWKIGLLAKVPVSIDVCVRCKIVLKIYVVLIPEPLS